MPNAPDSGKNSLIERVMPRFVREVGKPAGPCWTYCIYERIQFAPASSNQFECIRHLPIVCCICRDSKHVGGSGLADPLDSLIEDF
jgi:hypothetical protein